MTQLAFDDRSQRFAQTSFSYEVDPPPQGILEEELEVHVLVERRWAIEGDEDVDIAVVAFIAAGDRAKEAQARL